MKQQFLYVFNVEPTSYYFSEYVIVKETEKAFKIRMEETCYETIVHKNNIFPIEKKLIVDQFRRIYVKEEDIDLFKNKLLEMFESKIENLETCIQQLRGIINEQ